MLEEDSPPAHGMGTTTLRSTSFSAPNSDPWNSHSAGRRNTLNPMPNPNLPKQGHHSLTAATGCARNTQQLPKMHHSANTMSREQLQPMHNNNPLPLGAQSYPQGQPAATAVPSLAMHLLSSGGCERRVDPPLQSRGNLENPETS